MTSGTVQNVNEGVRREINHIPPKAEIKEDERCY